MKNILIAAVVALLIGLGLGYLLPHGSKLGAVSNNYQATIPPQWFVNGVAVGSSQQFVIGSNGNQTVTGNETLTGSQTASQYLTTTVGLSSSSPAALGSAASGHFIMAAGTTSAQASTTAVTANSDIQLSLEQTTPIAGTTCNTTVNASSTYAIATKVAGNGFTVTTAGAPTTNPFCYSYSITN